MMTQPSSSVRIGTPLAPDPNLYSHLTEKERMHSGWPHQPCSPDLIQARLRAQKLCLEFNQTAPDALPQRQAILAKLLHPNSQGKMMLIEPPFRVDYGDNLIVGDHFYANYDCLILDSARVEIGDNVLLAPGVHIYTATHPLDPESRKNMLATPLSPNYYELAAPVKIGNNCWIGGRALICPGVTIGDNVVVGAGAVVTKDVPSNVVVGGNPAKILRYLDGAEIPEEVLARHKLN